MLDKAFNAKEIEKKRYKLWEDSGVFGADVKSNKKQYCLPMPPPNVTGSLHMGHAFTYTIPDIISRYKRMKNNDVLWQPGTDHAGIATQMVVERNLEAEGTSRKELGREKFLERVWEWKEQSGNTITEQQRRLGTTPDWARERFTMDDGMSKAVRKVFVQLYKEKLIYKDKRLVNWDPKMQTAVSDLEVEQIEMNGHMWHFKYPLEGKEGEFITVATTRPETMLGDSAVAVHPDDDRYKDLVGKNAILPIVNKPIPIIADEYADPEKGTGAVKITPAHDFNDFEVGQRNNLEMISVLDKDAKLNENTPEKYQGMDRFEARKKIVAEMDELGLLDKVEDNVHAVPHDEKSKKVILEPFLTDQWYCDAETLAKPAIEAVETGKTKIIPPSAEKTYFGWMRNIRPWCISRQLWWGHQIPAWYGPEGSVFVEETEEEAYAAAKAEFGDDVKLEQDNDVLDTWFSSALWPFSTIGWPEKTEELDRYYPANTLVTGVDIIFFWVARMMMFGIHFMDEVPFKTVYLHGLVRDEKGQKMSKSKGNVIDPLNIIDKYGSDALRMTLTSMAAQGGGLKLSMDRVEGYRNFSTKIWNAARFCEMNECKLNPDYNPENNKHSISKWIVSELAATSKKAEDAIETFKFNELSSEIYQFTWGTFCDWYIELIKPVLQGNNEESKKEIRETTGWVLDKILTILNPIMPFITEELHSHLLGHSEMSEDKNNWLITQSWPEFGDNAIDSTAQEEMNWVINLITEIRSVRADMNVPASAKIKMLLKTNENTRQEQLSKYNDIICRLARLGSANVCSGEVEAGSIQAVFGDTIIVLPIADVIDIDKERERLKRDIEKATQTKDKINKMLSNPGFLAKAPEEVINEQKEAMKIADLKHQKLEKVLKQLGD